MSVDERHTMPYRILLGLSNDSQSEAAITDSISAAVTGCTPISQDLEGKATGSKCSDLVKRRRESQKRYRLRSIAAAAASRSLFTSTSERLQQAERQRTTLEVRNKLLETCLFAKLGPTVGPSPHISSRAGAIKVEISCRSTLKLNE